MQPVTTSSTRSVSLQAEEHHLRVTRTARYYVLGTPAGHVDQLWVVCHGYGQLARDFIRSFTAIAADNRLIVAPEALNRYYVDTAPRPHGADSPVAATWMTREDRDNEIADYIAYLDDLCAELKRVAPNARVTALGFSQGTATVSRWASAGNTRLHRVVLWGGSVAHDVPLRADLFGEATLTLVAGTRDHFVRSERLAAERERLHGAGLHHEFVQFEGGHRIDDGALRTLTV
jgi:predicted esterase